MAGVLAYEGDCLGRFGPKRSRPYRRHKLLVPHACTLEGAVDPARKPRTHLNFSLRRPDDWLSLEQFDAIFRDEWSKIDWAMGDVYLDERKGGCVAYSLKDGPEALLANSLSF